MKENFIFATQRFVCVCVCVCVYPRRIHQNNSSYVF